MKVTRRQLNKIIKEELQLNEAAPMLAALGAIPFAIAELVVYGKALTGAAKIVYNDPAFSETRKLLETLSDAVEKLPDAAKEGAVEFIRVTVNTALEKSKINLEKLKIDTEDEQAELGTSEQPDEDFEQSDTTDPDAGFPTSEV